jgi:adenylate cyclase
MDDPKPLPALAAQHVLHFGSFAVDPRRGVLRHPDGSEVTLRPKAMEVLRMLVERSGRVVERDALMNAVWPDVFVTDDNITQCIAEIRRALGRNASGILRTLPKRGYLLDCHASAAVPNTDPAALSGLISRNGLASSSPAARPSLAVLPFINLSGDPGQEYQSDGVADEIISRLARNRSLFVIARSSSFSYKGRAVRVEDIARDLGVRYVLEGSVRRNGSRVRINTQLVEVESGIHIWAERYDRDLTDIFVVQDEITQAVATEIGPAITEAERTRAIRKPAADLTAWEAYQRGMWHTSAGSDHDSDLGAAFFGQAVSLDPTFAEPHAMLARFHNGEATRGGGRALEEGLSLAESEARTALRLDAANSSAYTALAWIFNQRCDVVSALEHAERAIALNDNDPTGYLAMGHILTFAGRGAEARSALKSALRLDPRGQTALGAMHHIALSLYVDRDYAAAEAAARKAIRTHPEFPRTYPYLAATLAQVGQIHEASTVIKTIVSLAPRYVEFLTRSRPPWYRQEDYDHLLDGLRKAGWPG